MLEIGFDKLALVALLVGVIAGPDRLVQWSRAFVSGMRRVRAAYQGGKSRLVDELDTAAPDWRELDPRKFHPRRILRDITALDDPAAVRPEPTHATGAGFHAGIDDDAPLPFPARRHVAQASPAVSAAEVPAADSEPAAATTSISDSTSDRPSA